MSRETTVILTIRHGRTEFNCQRRYAGLIDVPLNREGMDQCKMASKSLMEPYDVVVTSALRRSIETANLLVGREKSICECALCNERNFGTMQGHTPQEVESIRPEIKYIKIGGDFHCLNPPRGETLPRVHKRAKKFYRFLLSQYQGMKILIVSHEVFLQQFHGVLRAETWRECMGHALSNLTLSTFVMRGTCLVTEDSRCLAAKRQEAWQAVSAYEDRGTVCQRGGSADRLLRHRVTMPIEEAPEPVRASRRREAVSQERA